jgi:hypothetical protein
MNMNLVYTRIAKVCALAGLGLSMFMLPNAAQAQQCDGDVTIAAREVRTARLVFSGSGCTDRTVTCEEIGESRGTIRGSRQKDIPGVYIGDGAQRITIDNCIIENWQEGIKLGAKDAQSGQGGNHRIWHNVLRNNTKDGLDCDGSTANDYWDNESHHNDENGFEFDYCHNSNDWGAPYIFENNRAHHNGKHGFSFDGSSSHRLHANTSTCNGWSGECSGTRISHQSDCDGTTFGHGLRVDSSTCDGKNPSTGIQADWNNWGDAGQGCGSNAGPDFAILRNSTYDNLESVYGSNTNRCSP